MSVKQLREAVVQAGAWYWFKAENGDEQIQSALMREGYRAGVDALRCYQEGEPTAAELYAAALKLWPVSRLHPLI
jgi:hypothetical protein